MRWIQHKGKDVGFVNKTYVTERKPIHFFVKYKGFGISEHILEQLQKMEVDFVRIVYHGSKGKIIYEASIPTYRLHGVSYVDDGDKQLVLSTAKMNKLLEEENGTRTSS